MTLSHLISWVSYRPPLKLRFLSSSKIERKIFGFGKNLFWKLVLCVEVTLVSKFYPVWWSITQKSSLGWRGRILEEIVFPETSQPTMSDLTQTMSDLQFEFSGTSQRKMSNLTEQCLSDSFSLMFIHCFDRILLTECPFDSILFLLAL
jgi:hypothetical protein